MFARLRARPVDLIVSAGLLILLCPTMVLAAVLVRRELGSPVLFRQHRIGLRGRTFTLYKFRTMAELSDARGEPLPDEARMTRFGRVLRSLSIDELPSLWNVLRGDMSLIGPRPLLPDYLPYYTERQRLRHSVRPGITGLAQVSGRNLLSWQERLELDVVYVLSRSRSLDVRIALKTVSMVINRVGVSSQDHVTMQRLDRTDLGNRPDAA